MSLCCLIVLYVYGLGLLHLVRGTRVREVHFNVASSIEHLIDRFIHPFDE